MTVGRVDVGGIRRRVREVYGRLIVDQPREWLEAGRQGRVRVTTRGLGGSGTSLELAVRRWLATSIDAPRLPLCRTYYSVMFARSMRCWTWLMVCCRRLGSDAEPRASSLSESNSWLGMRSPRAGAGEAEPIDGAGSTPARCKWLATIFSHFPREGRKAHRGRSGGGAHWSQTE